MVRLESSLLLIVPAVPCLDVSLGYTKGFLDKRGGRGSVHLHFPILIHFYQEHSAQGLGVMNLLVVERCLKHSQPAASRFSSGLMN